MLPEFPLPLIFHFVNIIVCYPIRILVEYRVAKIFQLEFIIGVDDWFHSVFFFYDAKPSENALLKLLVGLRLGLMFHVEHWRLVATFEFHLLDEIFSLCPSR